MPDHTERYDELSERNLEDVVGGGVIRNGAHLNGAYLNAAYLNGAYLNGAYLNGATWQNMYSTAPEEPPTKTIAPADSSD